MMLQVDKQQSHDTNGVSHDKVTVGDGSKTASALETNVAPPVSEKRPTPRFQFSGMSVEVRSDTVTVVVTLMTTVTCVVGGVV